jgi:branched-chain amino acid transport system ATP-binding protein
MIPFDEPSLGLAPDLVQQTFRFIAEVKNRGTTVLVVGQNALAALELAYRAYLLSSGTMVQQGTSAEFWPIRRFAKHISAGNGSVRGSLRHDLA